MLPYSEKGTLSTSPVIVVMEPDSSKNSKRCQQIEQPTVDSSSPCIYELFAVVIHSGGAYGGHYHAYIRDIQQDPFPIEETDELSVKADRITLQGTRVFTHSRN